MEKLQDATRVPLAGDENHYTLAGWMTSIDVAEFDTVGVASSPLTCRSNICCSGKTPVSFVIPDIFSNMLAAKTSPLTLRAVLNRSMNLFTIVSISTNGLGVFGRALPLNLPVNRDNHAIHARHRDTNRVGNHNCKYE